MVDFRVFGAGAHTVHNDKQFCNYFVPLHKALHLFKVAKDTVAAFCAPPLLMANVETKPTQSSSL
eukprot:3239594-Alexandrium_andersonii.AAC.1